MHITLKQLYKNNRYRLFELDGRCYIIDCDSNILFFLFPFLVYFFSHRSYEISREYYDELVVSENMQESYLKNNKLLPSISILCFLIGPITKNWLVRYFGNLNSRVTFYVLVFLFVGTFCYRLYYTRSRKISLDSKDRLNMKIKLYPRSFKVLFERLCLYLFITLFLILGVGTVITSPDNDLPIFLGVVVMLCFYSFLNIILLGIGEYKFQVPEIHTQKSLEEKLND